MPSSVVVSFAKKTGKPESEIEKLWDNTKELVKKDYPDVEVDSDNYFQLVTGILKKRLKLESISEMHSLKFPKDKFTLSEAKSWVNINDFNFVGINTHEESYEFILNGAGQYDSFKTKEIREGVCAVMGETTLTTDIAINPAPKKRTCPDGEYNGFPCFDVDSTDYFGGSVARRSGQKYAFQNEKVKSFLRENGYKKPFMVKYENNYLRVK